MRADAIAHSQKNARWTYRLEGDPDRAFAQARHQKLKQEITVEKGRVIQENFGDYPVSRIQECALIEVHIFASDKTGKYEKRLRARKGH